MGALRKRRGRLYYLLVTLVLFMVLYSFSTRSLVERTILDIVVLGILVSVVVLVKQTRRSLIISLVLGIPWVTATFSGLFAEAGGYVDITAGVFGTMFLFYITSVILQNVIRSRQVTVDTISGAIAAYLLLGILWAGAYRLLDVVQPGSFAGQTRAISQPGAEVPNYVYFSFTTLTTLGYGDITPATPPAKVIAILEAVTGPLYITILISQLVSKYVSRGLKRDVEEDI
ncbi:MAG: potassium channel family protein [bacterium]|jgi:hypothetical protein